MAIYIIIAVVVILVLYYISTFNKFVKLKNQAEESFSQIDAHLKQRYDLIPNLVETVKGYATHEEKTLTQVIKARNMAVKAEGIEGKDQAAKAFEGTLKNLFVVAEKYPELKANENFKELQSQLTKLEQEILQARKYYNAVVKTFNTSIQTFPNNIVVSMNKGKFEKMPYLEAAEEERKGVKVKF